MKYLLSITGILLVVSCGTSVKLSIPTQFSGQAEMMEVKGARKKVMSFGNFKTSKIRRGMHLKYPGWGKGYFLENLVLNEFGIQKDEIVAKEKDKFRYTISDGTRSAEVFARESQVTRSIRYRQTLIPSRIFNSYERIQQYQYVFSGVIATDTLSGGKQWNLVMSNLYDRRKDTVNSLFTIIRPDEEGFATDGQDSIFIRPLNLNKTESPNGRIGKMPFEVLAGYELRTRDGVSAIIDNIAHNIWFYKDLDAETKLVLGAIATAIFAKRVHDVKW